MPFGYTLGVSKKQVELYRKWSDSISKVDENYSPAVIIGNIKTRDPDYSQYKQGVYPNGMLWCFDGSRRGTQHCQRWCWCAAFRLVVGSYDCWRIPLPVVYGPARSAFIRCAFGFAV